MTQRSSTPDWLRTLGQLTDDGTACVVVTVASASGSTPREAGAKMIVTADRVFGTIGGGALEHGCIAEARAILERQDASPLLRQVPLGPALGQCCGGAASILFEPMGTVWPQLWLFGAGHVGRALVEVLSGLPVRIVWVDQRAEQFPDRMPANVSMRVTGMPEAEIADAAPGAIVLVMTHSHALDEAIVAEALRRTDLRFIGLIGSSTKRARFDRRLREAGLPVERLVCPIGVSGIRDKHPRAIAIATAAQILQILQRGSPTQPPIGPHGSGVGETTRASHAVGPDVAADQRGVP